jgi:hypothetical protein
MSGMLSAHFNNGELDAIAKKLDLWEMELLWCVVWTGASA